MAPRTGQIKRQTTSGISHANINISFKLSPISRPISSYPRHFLERATQAISLVQYCFDHHLVKRIKKPWTNCFVYPIEPVLASASGTHLYAATFHVRLPIGLIARYRRRPFALIGYRLRTCTPLSHVAVVKDMSWEGDVADCVLRKVGSSCRIPATTPKAFSIGFRILILGSPNAAPGKPSAEPDNGPKGQYHEEESLQAFRKRHDVHRQGQYQRPKHERCVDALVVSPDWYQA